MLEPIDLPKPKFKGISFSQSADHQATHTVEAKMFDFNISFDDPS